MDYVTLESPFGNEPLEEIPLRDAPLVRVLVQVRFESLAVFIRPEPIVPFVEHLIERYPNLEDGVESEIIVRAGGITQKDSASRIWRLRSQDGQWTITVTNGSLALETTKYESRDLFVDRFNEMINAFVATIGNPSVKRIGVRYTDQVSSSSVDRFELKNLIREEAHGGLAVPTQSPAVLRHSFNDSMFVIGERAIQARSGWLPAGTIFDPALPPVASESWFLDIDSFTARDFDMNSNDLDSELRSLADQAYRMFRWLVTKEFLIRFGGDVS